MCYCIYKVGQILKKYFPELTVCVSSPGTGIPHDSLDLALLTDKSGRFSIIFLIAVEYSGGRITKDKNISVSDFIEIANA